jgi:hypothetical protein
MIQDEKVPISRRSNSWAGVGVMGRGIVLEVPLTFTLIFTFWSVAFVVSMPSIQIIYYLIYSAPLSWLLSLPSLFYRVAGQPLRLVGGAQLHPTVLLSSSPLLYLTSIIPSPSAFLCTV